MRFLHTADWHLGRTLRGRSRAEEMHDVLAEILDVATHERVDVLIVAGDIFDSASPGPGSERLLFDSLREFVGAGVEVLLLAGNHDSPRRLEAMGRLSELVGVRVQSNVILPASAGGIVTFTRGPAGHPGMQEAEVAEVAAIPWVPDGKVLDALEVVQDEAESRKTYHDRVANVYARMVEGFMPGRIHLLAGHLFVDGALLAAVDGSERRLHIDKTYGVSPQALPAEPQYLALGHIHQPQVIADAPAPTAYAGSPLQLDFGERGQQKVVRVIDARPGRPVEQRAIPLARGRQLMELRGTPDAVIAAAAGAGDAYVRAVLEVDAPEPGLAQRLREAIPQAVDVRLDYQRDDAASPESEFATLSPEQLFVRYYRAEHGAEPRLELLALFRELMEEAVVLS